MRTNPRIQGILSLIANGTPVKGLKRKYLLTQDESRYSFLQQHYICYAGKISQVKERYKQKQNIYR